MKITCQKTDLLNSVNIALKAVSSKTTMPILECIMIEVTDVIRFISNDMELGIKTIVQGNIEQKGKIAINSPPGTQFERTIPDNEVLIQTDDKFTMHITCEKAKFVIAGKSSEEFPAIPQIEKAEALELSQFTLKEVIRQTVFSISDNENNKIMTGELFEISEKTFRVVSLDGSRISIRKVELEKIFPATKVIVPGKTLN